MATTASITSSYAGEHAGKWISAALQEGLTLKNNLIEFLPNVKYKAVVSNLVSASGLADATCDFTSTGAITLTERVLTPKELQVNKVICKQDFHATWQAIEMGYSAHDVLPKSFADYLLSHQVLQVAKDIETSIWNGATGTSGQFNGFMTLLTTDANLPSANEVAGTTLSASNILVEMRKVVDAIPTRMLWNQDLRIYVSQAAARFYIQALGGFGASGLGSNGVANSGTTWYAGQDLYIDGVKIEIAPGLTTNQMLATLKTNLFFGTGLFSDQTEIHMIDQALIDGSQNVKMVMRFTAGVQYGNVSDIVTYGITNSAN